MPPWIAAWRSFSFSVRPASIRNCAPQPITEEALLTGPLEPTNEWYAIAKIAGIKLCAGLPAPVRLRFHLAPCRPTSTAPATISISNTSHVVPALLRKVSRGRAGQARPTSTSGVRATPRREFLHVDDLADACVFLMRALFGRDPRQCRLRHGGLDCGTRRTDPRSSAIRRVRLRHARPDGTPRKLADTARLNALGWNHARPLREGMRQTFEHWQQDSRGEAF